MDTFTIFTWCLTAATIFGTYLNSRQNKYGFLVWGMCNMLWLCVDFNRGIYAQAALYVVFIGFNIYGWRQWMKQESEISWHKGRLLQTENMLKSIILDRDELREENRILREKCANLRSMQNRQRRKRG